MANGGKIVCETDNGALPASKRLLKDEAYHAQQVRQQVFGGDDALQARFAVLRSVLYGRTRITLLECANGPEDEE